MFADLQRDVVVPISSRGVRVFAFSYLGVVFAIYLSQLGYSTVTAISPSVSAYLMQAFSLNVPILLGGSLQLFHDCTFYYMFRNSRPPEEGQQA